MRRGAMVVLALLLFALGPAMADEEAARYFTRRGQESLSAGDFGEADKQFRKALSEAPGFLPAILGLAETALEQKDEAEAVGVLESLLDEAEKTPPNAEGRAVVEQAEEMLKKLDRPRYDYRRLLSKYVGDLLALARASEKSSPDLAGRCADRVDRLSPGHPGAKEILDRVGRPSSGAAPDAAAPAAAGNEELLFNGKDTSDWEGITDKWKIENGVLIGTIMDGAYFINYAKQITGDYTLVVEMRVREPGKSPRLGMHVGFKGTDETFELDIFSQSFALGQRKGEGQKVKIARVDPFEVMSGFDQNQWNTYVVQVEGSTLTFTVNGKQVFEHEAPEDAGIFDGYPGLIVQCCVAEFRKIAVIR